MLDTPATWAEPQPEHASTRPYAVRANALRTALIGAGARIVPAGSHGDAALHAVHDPGMLAHLAGAGRDDPSGAPRPDGDRYSFAPGSPVDAQTWPVVRGAVDATLAAVDLLVGGEPLAYAICQVPGLHATHAGYGCGSYLNNAAIAAVALRAAGVRRVAILDLDAHHGDGTQSLFYDRADVFYGSVHLDAATGLSPADCDPAGRPAGGHPVGDRVVGDRVVGGRAVGDRVAGGRAVGGRAVGGHVLDGPPITGSAGERGRAAGMGTTRNVPLPAGIGDPGWLAALAWVRAEAAEFGAEAVVLSLGVDASADEPDRPFEVSGAGFRTAGELIRDLRLPVVVVPEEGRPATFGPSTVATLYGLSGRY